MKLKFLTFLVVVPLMSTLLFSDDSPRLEDIDMKAALYEMGTHTLQFNWVMEQYPDSNIPYKTYFYTPSHQLSVKETMIIDPETQKLSFYEYTRYELNETSSITVTQNRVLMVQSINGERKTKILPEPQNLVAGPLTVPFISDHMHELLKGDVLIINYAVIDRLAFYAFTLHLDKTHPEYSDDNVVIKMFPQSLIVQQFVDPLYFILNASGDQLHKIIGRTLAIKKEGNKVLPVNADFVVKEQLWPKLRLSTQYD